MHLWDLLFIYGAQVVQGIPGPHKSMFEWCTYLGGDVLQLDPLRLICLFEYTWCSLKGALKGKGELGRCIDFHCTPVLVYSLPSSYLCSYCLFALNWQFWWGNGVNGAKNDLVLVLNAKGGEIKAKENGSANHLWISKKIVELESLCLIKTLLLQNCSLMGEKFRYGKKVEFVAFDQIYSWKISWFAKTSVLI